MNTQMKSIETPITEEELAELEAKCAHRTPGELGAEYTTEGGFGPDHKRCRVRLAIMGGDYLHKTSMEELRDGDHAYLEAAWNNLPRLIAEVRRCREHDRALHEWCKRKSAETYDMATEPAELKRQEGGEG